MSCLKNRMSRTAAILTACGALTAGGYGFLKIDETSIVPREVFPPDKTVSTKQESDILIRSTQNGSVTINAETENSVHNQTVPSHNSVISAPKPLRTITSSYYISETLPSENKTETITKETSAETVKTENKKTSSAKKGTAVSDVNTLSVHITSSDAVSTSENTNSFSTKKTTVSKETSVKSTTASKTTNLTVSSKSSSTETTKQTTTKPPVTDTKPVTTTTKTTKPAVDNGNTPESRLNAAALNVNECLNGNEDEIIKKYLAKIINNDMTNYEKAVAVYDYLINNTYYAYGGWGKPVQAVLEEGYGTCTEYSYVLSAMMNYMGFNAKTVDGLTAMAAGGYGYHMWVEVTINGQVYVMDAQVDDNMSWGGNISHARFVKTYDEVRGQYIKY